MGNNLTQKEFTEALNALAATETFTLTLTDKQSYTFSQLTTSQLKSLVQAVVDSPITQSVFNSTMSHVMHQSLVSVVSEQYAVSKFNTVDRLIFSLKTRIESLSPTLTLTPENAKPVTVDLQNVLDKVLKGVNEYVSNFDTQRIASADGNISIVCGIPLIATDIRMSEELYKNTNIDVDTPEELRKALGNAFIYEIVKSIREVHLSDKVLDFSTLPIKARVDMVETFPASLIKTVIAYIEAYKKILDKCLKVDDEHSVPLDGSLFSLH